MASSEQSDPLPDPPATPLRAGKVAATQKVACFLAGTRVLTEFGEKRVEALQAGDVVLTWSGEYRPVRWIGVRSFQNRFVRDDPQIMPVRIEVGALGDGLPHAPLCVSPEHALLLEDVLVPAKLLLGCEGIAQLSGLFDIDYFHVELESHDILVAEGAPAESFVDCDSRLLFQNAASFAEAYPGVQAPRWTFCAPRVEHGPVLAAIRARLNGKPPPDPGRITQGHLDMATHERCAGWAWAPGEPEAALEVEILLDGGVIGRVTANRLRADVLAQGVGTGRYGFEFTMPPRLSRFRTHDVSARVVGGGALCGSVALAGAPEPGEQGLADIGTVLQARAATGDLREVATFLLDQWRCVRRFHRAGNDAPLALVLDVRLPRPQRDAGSAAVCSHVRALQRAGFHVVFVPLSQPVLGRAELPGLPGVTVATAPDYVSVEDVLRQHGEAALVYVHRVEAMSLYGNLVRRLCSGAHLVFSVADLHFLRVERQAALDRRPSRLRESLVLREQELAALRLADVTITHSPVEAALLRSLDETATVHVVPWDVPVRPVARPWSERRGFAFVADFSHAPNRHGLRWLVRSVMPEVKRLHPGFEGLVVGADLPTADRRALPDGLTVLGPVEDLDSVYGAVRLCVAPLCFGAGIKKKVLDSLAQGLPCVMTPMAAEGLVLHPALSGLVAEHPHAFARLVVELHEDAVRAEAAAQAGLHHAAEWLTPAQVDAALGPAIACAQNPRVERRRRA